MNRGLFIPTLLAATLIICIATRCKSGHDKKQTPVTDTTGRQQPVTGNQNNEAIDDIRKPPASIIESYRKIVRLIKEDKVIELASLVEYPLQRQNPLPDITTAGQFISYYTVLIDSAFKKKVSLYDDSVIFERNGAYGLVGGAFDGDIWINEDGRISTINYMSRQEEQLRDGMTKDIQSKIHPSVSSWQSNVLVARSQNLLIRIDHTDKGLRYASWSKGRPTSEAPDLILYNGVEEAQGSMGGWTWTFANGDWTYLVDDVEMCETPENCGLFLRLSFKDVDKSTVRLTEIK